MVTPAVLLAALPAATVAVSSYALRSTAEPRVAADDWRWFKPLYWSVPTPW